MTGSIWSSKMEERGGGVMDKAKWKEKGQGRIGAHGAARRQFKIGEGALCRRSA